MRTGKQSPEHVAKRLKSRRLNNPNYMPPGYTAWNKGKTKETDPRIEKYASSLRIGRKFHTEGYVLIYRPKHERCDRTGYVLEHLVTMEEKLGRPLYNYEVVHHIDGDRTNNTVDNLQLMTLKEHSRLHFKGWSEESISKRIETQKANGTSGGTSDSAKKAWETRRLNGTDSGWKVVNRKRR